MSKPIVICSNEPEERLPGSVSTCCSSCNTSIIYSPSTIRALQQDYPGIKPEEVRFMCNQCGFHNLLMQLASNADELKILPISKEQKQEIVDHFFKKKNRHN